MNVVIAERISLRPCGQCYADEHGKQIHSDIGEAVICRPLCFTLLAAEHLLALVVYTAKQSRTTEAARTVMDLQCLKVYVNNADRCQVFYGVPQSHVVWSIVDFGTLMLMTPTPCSSSGGHTTAVSSTS